MACRTSYITVVFMILIMVMYALGQMIGVAKVFEMLFGINYNLALICGGALIVGYVTIGGMYGTSYNAAFQMILMGIAFIIPLGAIMKAMGGTGWFFPPLLYSDMVPAMLDAVPDFFDMKYGFKWYLSLIPCFTLGAMGLPHLGMRVYTSSNLKSARGAMVWFTFFCGIVFCSTYTMGFSGVFFQATSGSAIAPTDFDKITLILNSVYNPAWVLAFVIAGAIAAGLSTISANLMAIGAMIAQDIIATIKPDLSDKTMKIIGYLAICRRRRGQYPDCPESADVSGGQYPLGLRPGRSHRCPAGHSRGLVETGQPLRRFGGRSGFRSDLYRSIALSVPRIS